MKTLEQLSLEMTQKNIVVKSTTTSMNHRIVEVLKNGKPMERVKLINEITLMRLKDKYPEDKLIKLFTEQSKDFQAEFNKLNRTCKNGVDTSLANGNTNANFSFNPEFNKTWKIKKFDGMIQLIKL